MSDKDLLSRLNALKPSRITPESDDDPAPDKTDALTARFLALARTSGPVPLKPEAEQSTPRNEEDDKTLAELLAELGGDEEEWGLGAGDDQEVRAVLMEGMKATDTRLETDAPLETDTPLEGDKGGDYADRLKARFTWDGEYVQGDIERNKAHWPFERRNKKLRYAEEDEEDEEGRLEFEDEAAAEEYVARVLEELSLEGVTPVGAEHGLDEPMDVWAGSLPSAPSDLPVREPDLDHLAESEEAGQYFNIPDTPKFDPKSKPVKVVKKKPSYSDFTQEGIDSWCCICNSDATLECLGCEGDRYCSVCWLDGHGTGPGQEQGHKALEYTKGKGVAAAA